MNEDILKYVATKHDPENPVTKDEFRRSQSEILSRLDKIITTVKRLDQERLFTFEYVKRLEGRVERLWETLQDRLTLEMRLAGVRTIEEANLFLPVFIEHYNRRFAVVPENKETAYRETVLDIDTILVRKMRRKVDNGSTFTYMGIKYQMVNGETIVPATVHSAVNVLIDSTDAIRAECNGCVYSTRAFKKPVKNTAASEPKAPYVPTKDHPWRTGLSKGLAYNKNDRAIKALYSSSSAHL